VEGGVEGGVAVDEGADRDGVLQDAGGVEFAVAVDDADGLAGLVDLDAEGAGEADDPDQAGAELEQLGDLEAELGLVLAGVGELDRQRGRPAWPSRGRGRRCRR
jgi:hypothetical protein